MKKCCMTETVSYNDFRKVNFSLIEKKIYLEEYMDQLDRTLSSNSDYTRPCGPPVRTVCDRRSTRTRDTRTIPPHFQDSTPARGYHSPANCRSIPCKRNRRHCHPRSCSRDAAGRFRPWRSDEFFSSPRGPDKIATRVRQTDDKQRNFFIILRHIDIY